MKKTYWYQGSQFPFTRENYDLNRIKEGIIKAYGKQEAEEKLKKKFKYIWVDYRGEDLTKCKGCKKHYLTINDMNNFCWVCDVEMMYVHLSNYTAKLWNKINKFEDNVPKKRIAEIILKDIIIMPPILKNRPKWKRIRRRWEKELNYETKLYRKQKIL